ncbi:hypothetical protein [Patulibacter sp.]|uniref:hypothetical protein n=1 Tax=Patulibacter sp. TaxID=1912859 RepID=UPI002723E0AC|nr:hypothetical protein [Patulibacter sp.]MDO9408243.1 hypothetical protein [Patulibacter sp.]
MRAMNLLPVEERGGSRPTRGASSSLTVNHAIAGAGAVVVVGLVGLWAVTKSDTATAREAEVAAVAASAADQAQVTRLAPVVAFDARRQARESAVLQLASGRTDWAMVLRATAGSLPSNVSITTLQLAAANATGAAAGGTTSTATPAGLAGTGSVTLQICADTQPRVATTLRRFRALPQVEDVALSQTARSASGSGSSGASAGGGGCSRVTADAALGLSAQTIIDGAATAAAATTGTAATPGAAATPDAATTTSSSTTTTNGTGR